MASSIKEDLLQMESKDKKEYNFLSIKPMPEIIQTYLINY